MKRFLDFLWPAIGAIAVVASLWLLSREFKGEAVAAQVWHQLGAITPGHYLLSIACALAAYAALAWHDRIALLHLGVGRVSIVFVALCSFTTYALSHTIGATVFSGAMVRYRAYSSKGLSAAQIAILVALCSITFGSAACCWLGGLILVCEPQELRRVGGHAAPHPHQHPARPGGRRHVAAGGRRLRVRLDQGPAAVRVRPLPHRLPARRRHRAAARRRPAGADRRRRHLVFRTAGGGQPGLRGDPRDFRRRLLGGAWCRTAPAGAGVFDLLFINALPTIPKAKVLAAVLVFRLFYLFVPLTFAIVVVFLFERRRLGQALHQDGAGGPDGGRIEDGEFDRRPRFTSEPGPELTPFPPPPPVRRGSAGGASCAGRRGRAGRSTSARTGTRRR